MADQIIVIDPDLYHANSKSGPGDWISQRTSIGSSIYRGLMENCRRYQTLRLEEYFIPSNDQQFEIYDAGHLVAFAMDSDQTNPLFLSPVGDSPTVRHPTDVASAKWVKRCASTECERQDYVQSMSSDVSTVSSASSSSDTYTASVVIPIGYPTTKPSSRPSTPACCRTLARPMIDLPHTEHQENFCETLLSNLHTRCSNVPG
ncbi:hypothetical protein CBS147333_10117 [Penicillium roqueforti]|nr:hypothetical protein CBS147333_10117 [Penicillium roqueforti]